MAKFSYLWEKRVGRKVVDWKLVEVSEGSGKVPSVVVKVDAMELRKHGIQRGVEVRMSLIKALRLAAAILDIATKYPLVVGEGRKAGGGRRRGLGKADKGGSDSEEEGVEEL